MYAEFWNKDLMVRTISCSYMEINRGDKILYSCVFYALPFPAKGSYTLCRNCWQTLIRERRQISLLMLSELIYIRIEINLFNVRNKIWRSSFGNLVSKSSYMN